MRKFIFIPLICQLISLSTHGEGRQELKEFPESNSLDASEQAANQSYAHSEECEHGCETPDHSGVSLQDSSIFWQDENLQEKESDQ